MFRQEPNKDGLSWMPSVPRITGAEAKKAFGKAGFLQDRMKDSHCILKKPGHKYILSIPMHGNKILGLGLLKSQIDAAGLTVEQFNALL
jgi:predicted RNA binding protein YcfA (HicA-like mRNA interferase family)